MSIASFAKSFFNNLINKNYKEIAPDLGKMLLYTGAVGWVLSSLAHVIAIGINRKIDKDQKAFLVPQEMADAAVNIALFIVVTRSFTKFGENLVKRGKLITKDIAKLLKEDAFAEKLGRKFTTEIKSNLTKTFSEGFEDLEKGVLTKPVENTVTKKLEIPDLQVFKNNKGNLQGIYYKFFDGVSFISSTIGSIISCNLLTPYFRNIYAAKKQRFDTGKVTTLDRPILPAIPRTGMDDFRQKILTRPNTTPSTSMKI